MLELLNTHIRALPGVYSAETLVYLKTVSSNITGGPGKGITDPIGMALTCERRKLRCGGTPRT
jgi:hypothetical protein